jgi:uncharacterized SAM-binding protein YcdF (DUF218 family)
LSVFLNPFFWIIVLLIFSLVFYRRKNTKKILFTGLILIYFFSNSFIIEELMRTWETPLTKTENLNKVYDVGIVLGGGMISYDQENDRLTYRNNIDRLLQAVELYKKGRIKNILISGGAGHLIYSEVLESTYLRNFLLTIGIDTNHITIDSLSDNTHENAVFTAEILNKEFPGQNYLLITSAIHMPRSMACFKKEGISTSPYSTNKYAGSRRFDFECLFIPQAINFRLWDIWLHEVLGYGVYKWMGYL